MFKKLDIIDDMNKKDLKILRSVSKEVTFPLSDSDKEIIEHIIKHLTYSQIEKYE